jgi:acyl-CoA dehydrogenase
VLDTAAAERIYVYARTGSGTAIFAVERTAPGLEISGSNTVDQTRKQGNLTLADTPARLVGAADGGAAALAHALDIAAVALVAEQAGGATHAMRMAADYANTLPVRPRDRQLPGGQAHVCRHAAGGGVGGLGGASRRRRIRRPGPDRHRSRSGTGVLLRRSCSSRRPTSRCTAASASPGSTLRTSTCAEPAPTPMFGDPAWHRERYVQLREAGA